MNGAMGYDRAGADHQSFHLGDDMDTAAAIGDGLAAIARRRIAECLVDHAIHASGIKGAESNFEVGVLS